MYVIIFNKTLKEYFQKRKNIFHILFAVHGIKMPRRVREENDFLCGRRRRRQRRGFAQNSKRKTVARRSYLQKIQTRLFTQRIRSSVYPMHQQWRQLPQQWREPGNYQKDRERKHVHEQGRERERKRERQ